MLPTDVLNTLRALSLNERPLITPAPDTKSGSKGAFELGQRVQGTVQSSVGTGVFTVRVLEKMMNMKLPANLKSGDVVELQVMSLQPRLTFSLSNLANALPISQQLSNAARLLASISQQPLGKAHVRALRSEPLLTTSASPPDTSKLAGKLHESLSQSGLFYESHQAEWLAGSRSTAQLLLEPQNRLTDVAARSAQALGSSAANIAAQHDGPSIPQQLQPLVQQQLNAMETRQVLWQGHVWPNQAMDWEIHEETPRRSETSYEEAGGQWATQVRLDLPNLGEVAAMLRFNTHGLSVTLDASDERTRALFGSSSSALSAALAERGITVISTLVTSHDKT